MKTNNILILICISALSCILLSCSKNNLNSYSPYHYFLKIKIVDKQGNDLIHGIYAANNETDPSRYKVKENVYELNVKQTGKKNERLFSVLSVETIDSYDCLVVHTATLPLPDYRPLQLEHKLICSYIFGDEEERTIISNWEDSKKVDSFCTDIIFDGKSYSVEEVDSEGYPIFHIEVGE